MQEACTLNRQFNKERADVNERLPQRVVASFQRRGPNCPHAYAIEDACRAEV